MHLPAIDWSRLMRKTIPRDCAGQKKRPVDMFLHKEFWQLLWGELRAFLSPVLSSSRGHHVIAGHAYISSWRQKQILMHKKDLQWKEIPINNSNWQNKINSLTKIKFSAIIIFVCHDWTWNAHLTAAVILHTRLLWGGSHEYAKFNRTKQPGPRS